jgi:hypothetical protein
MIQFSFLEVREQLKVQQEGKVPLFLSFLKYTPTSKKKITNKLINEINLFQPSYKHLVALMHIGVYSHNINNVMG